MFDRLSSSWYTIYMINDLYQHTYRPWLCLTSFQRTLRCPIRPRHLKVLPYYRSSLCQKTAGRLEVSLAPIHLVQVMTAHIYVCFAVRAMSEEWCKSGTYLIDLNDPISLSLILFLIPSPPSFMLDFIPSSRHYAICI